VVILPRGSGEHGGPDGGGGRRRQNRGEDHG
jgi:hypothetical protein